MILTGFQLRAARKALNLTFKQLQQNTNVSYLILERLERDTENLENIECSATNAENLLNYFTKNKLIFSDKNTIAINIEIDPKPIENNLTRFQFIVARTALRLTQEGLSRFTGVPKPAITGYEKKTNNQYIISRYSYLEGLIKSFEKNNIKFPTNISVKLNYYN